MGLTDEEYTAAVDAGTYTNFVNDSAGYGLAQWTYWSRKQNLHDFAKSAGKSIGDLEVQLAFLWKELTSYGLLADLNAASSVREASNLILLKFEKPADQSETAQARRAGYGQTYFDKYTNQTEPEEKEMRYNKISEMPSYAQPTIIKMVDAGLIGGTGTGAKDENNRPADLDLSIDMIRVFITNDRAGLYDKE